MSRPINPTMVNRVPLLKWSCFLFVAVVYLPTLAEIAHSWSSHPYAAHGVLAPVLSALLLWHRRRDLREHAGAGHGAGLILLAGAAGLAAGGHAADSIAGHVASAVLASMALALWLGGMAWTRRAAPALLFLLFMLPLPRGVATGITLPLQLFAAGVAAGILELLHIPAAHAGVLIQVAGVNLRVDESGNGLRFLMVLVVITTAFALVHLPTPARRLIVIVAAVPAAVFANALRVTAIAATAHLMGPQAALGSLHDYTGRIVWALAVISMLSLGVILGGNVAPRGSRPEAC
jgi:exosortase